MSDNGSATKVYFNPPQFYTIGYCRVESSNDDLLWLYDMNGIFPEWSEVERIQKACQNILLQNRDAYERHRFDKLNDLEVECTTQNNVKQSTDDKVSLPDDNGYVYLIECGGKYKIGRTSSLQKRINHFSVKFPFPVNTIHTIKTNDMVLLENILHDTYCSKNIDGEWFDLSGENIQEIKDLGDEVQY